MSKGQEAREVLAELDKRLRACFGLPISAEEAYDSFYQEMVAAALTEQGAAGPHLADQTERVGEGVQPPDGITERYEELIYAVGNKYPGETRHETALRYIKRAEASGVGEPSKTASGLPHGAPETDQKGEGL